jgi:hypothetical protein
MRLAGEWNWWSPRPLRRIYQRWGISEHDGDEGAGHDLVPASPAGANGAGNGDATGRAVTVAERGHGREDGPSDADAASSPDDDHDARIHQLDAHRR